MTPPTYPAPKPFGLTVSPVPCSLESSALSITSETADPPLAAAPPSRSSKQSILMGVSSVDRNESAHTQSAIESASASVFRATEFGDTFDLLTIDPTAPYKIATTPTPVTTPTVITRTQLHRDPTHSVTVVTTSTLHATPRALVPLILRDLPFYLPHTPAPTSANDTSQKTNYNAKTIYKDHASPGDGVQVSSLSFIHSLKSPPSKTTAPTYTHTPFTLTFTLTPPKHTGLLNLSSPTTIAITQTPLNLIPPSHHVRVSAAAASLLTLPPPITGLITLTPTRHNCTHLTISLNTPLPPPSSLPPLIGTLKQKGLFAGQKTSVGLSSRSSLAGSKTHLSKPHMSPPSSTPGGTMDGRHAREVLAHVGAVVAGLGGATARGEQVDGEVAEYFGTVVLSGGGGESRREGKLVDGCLGATGEVKWGRLPSSLGVQRFAGRAKGGGWGKTVMQVSSGPGEGVARVWREGERGRGLWESENGKGSRYRVVQVLNSHTQVRSQVYKVPRSHGGRRVFNSAWVWRDVSHATPSSDPESGESRVLSFVVAFDEIREHYSDEEIRELFEEEVRARRAKRALLIYEKLALLPSHQPSLALFTRALALYSRSLRSPSTNPRSYLILTHTLHARFTRRWSLLPGECGDTFCSRGGRGSSVPLLAWWKSQVTGGGVGISPVVSLVKLCSWVFYSSEGITRWMRRLERRMGGRRR